jgi:hypothetical protein
MPSAGGFKWDVAGDPDPENGHAIMGLGYYPTGIIVDSWGMIGCLTWAAIAKYCTTNAGGSLYAMITPDQLAKGQTKAPNGLLWSQLIKLLAFLFYARKYQLLCHNCNWAKHLLGVCPHQQKQQVK